MARRTRTLEILTAAGLVPQQLAVEQARGARDARVAQALASLVPSTINAGAGALGKLADYQAEQDLLALRRDNLAAKGETDKAAAASQMARADAMKAKAEADRVKAVADAAEAARKAEEAAAKEKRQGAVDAIEGGAGSAAALLPTGGERRVVGTFRPGESPLDEIERVQAASGVPFDQLAGMVDKQGLETRKAAADVKLAEREAVAPLGPRPKSPEEIERQRKKDELLDEQLKQLKGKPEVAAQAEARDAAKLTTEQQKEVANIAASRRALARISEEAKRVDPNLLLAAKNAVLNTVGVDDGLTNYVAEIRNFNSAVGAMRSGASIGVAEQKRLDSFLVAPQDTIGTVEQKRRAFEQYLQDKEAGINASRRAQNLPEANLSGTPMKPVSEMTDEELEAELAGGG